MSLTSGKRLTHRKLNPLPSTLPPFLSPHPFLFILAPSLFASFPLSLPLPFPFSNPSHLSPHPFLLLFSPAFFPPLVSLPSPKMVCKKDLSQFLLFFFLGGGDSKIQNHYYFAPKTSSIVHLGIRTLDLTQTGSVYHCHGECPSQQ